MSAAKKPRVSISGLRRMIRNIDTGTWNDPETHEEVRKLRSARFDRERELFNNDKKLQEIRAKTEALENSIQERSRRLIQEKRELNTLLDLGEITDDVVIRIKKLAGILPGD